jgi:hypothetical protein
MDSAWTSSPLLLGVLVGLAGVLLVLALLTLRRP